MKATPMKSSDIMFEFTNSIRVKIIVSLMENSQRMSDIAKMVDVTSAEVSRHLDRLLKVNILTKTAEGRYEITPYGQVLFVMFSTWEIVVENEEFLTDRRIDTLPPPLRNMMMFTDAKISSGTMTNMERATDDSRNAKEFIYLIGNEIMKHVVDMEVESAKKGVEIKKIYQSDVKIPEKFLKSKHIQIRTMKRIPFVLKMCENHGGLAFYRGDKIDFNECISGDTEHYLYWLKLVFNYFWERATHLKA